MGEKNIAVAGATGAVGTEMLKVLEARNFPVKNIKMLASHRSVGKKLPFRGEDIAVEELKKDSFGDVDIALFSAGASRSKEFAPAAVEAGTVVVDNSSAFRLDDGVPLVVPEVNGHRIKEHKGIIANPNCSTIIAMVAVYPLHKAAGIKRMVVSTYQAVSGTGAQAIIELDKQARAYLAGEAIETDVYPHQIAFNLLPHIGDFGDNGYSSEEMKMLNEGRKIMEHPDLRVSCTTIRVPVFRAHSEAINLELEKPLPPEEARKILAEAPGVKVVDDPGNCVYPMPLDATGRDDVLVGRIRQDASIENGLDLWVSGDQLLKGAALNAVQIAEALL
ncbi:MAG: aspartate-semialdehyde dehydrogenase [Planctomycetes bacterium]|nr:aspartate-semialdehyde dehydrogenase [Planctomycetota bacterium]